MDFRNLKEDNKRHQNVLNRVHVFHFPSTFLRRLKLIQVLLKRKLQRL